MAIMKCWRVAGTGFTLLHPCLPCLLKIRSPWSISRLLRIRVTWTLRLRSCRAADTLSTHCLVNAKVHIITCTRGRLLQINGRNKKKVAFERLQHHNFRYLPDIALRIRHRLWQNCIFTAVDGCNMLEIKINRSSAKVFSIQMMCNGYFVSLKRFTNWADNRAFVYKSTASFTRRCTGRRRI